MEKNIVLMGCGDVGPIHEPMDGYSTLARAQLALADIRFAQCERVYSERGSPQVHASRFGTYERAKPHMASVFSDCGFNVVSVASNHSLDWGEDALLDTIELLRSKGIQTVGAGKNIEEARKPAFVEKNGVRVAILAYCSVLNEGYAAGPRTAGAAPLRVHTYYEPFEYQAGMPPRVVTVPYDEDMAAMAMDISEAKKQAHAVVVSFHWGLHFIPRVIADYQPVAARAAFDAGADIILGHHAHLPKAIGTHDGKVCFYSLSNFIMTTTSGVTPGRTALFAKRYGVTLDPEYPHAPFGMDAKRSLIAKAQISARGITKVSFLPVMIDKQLRPEILRRNDARFQDAVNFMDHVSEEFDHNFSVEDDEVVISGSEKAAQT